MRRHRRGAGGAGTQLRGRLGRCVATAGGVEHGGRRCASWGERVQEGAAGGREQQRCAARRAESGSVVAWCRQARRRGRRRCTPRPSSFNASPQPSVGERAQRVDETHYESQQQRRRFHLCVDRQGRGREGLAVALGRSGKGERYRLGKRQGLGVCSNSARSSGSTSITPSWYQRRKGKASKISY